MDGAAPGSNASTQEGMHSRMQRQNGLGESLRTYAKQLLVVFDMDHTLVRPCMPELWGDLVCLTDMTAT